MGCLKTHIEWEPNLRLVYSKKGQKPLKNRINYYPFGLDHNYGLNAPMSIVSGRDHKWKYNGKEQMKDLGVNVTEMDWRQYDNALGRFHGIDALAATEPHRTPYHFGRNNPIVFSDPSGLKVVANQNNVTYTDAGYTPYDRDTPHWTEELGLGGVYGASAEAAWAAHRAESSKGGGQRFVNRNGIGRFFYRLFGGDTNSYRYYLREVGGGNNSNVTPNLYLGDVFGGEQPNLYSMLEDAGYDDDSHVPTTKEGVHYLINKIPQLKKFYKASGSPKIFKPRPNSTNKTTYNHQIGGLTMRGNAYWVGPNKTSLIRFTSTMFHELYHAYQNTVTHAVLNGKTISDHIKDNTGGIDFQFQRGSLYLETQAYYFEIFLGNRDPDVKEQFENKRNQFINYEN